MTQSEYIPISVREKIEDKNIAKVCDYLERHSKSLWYIDIGGAKKIDLEKYSLSFFGGMTRVYDSNLQTVFYGPTNLLADNIVGIWGSLKNL